MEKQQILPERRLPSVENRRRAEAAVAPFLKALRGWNARAAYLAARATSAYSSPEERALARLEGGALLAEVTHRYAEFRVATKGETPHGRIDDVDAAFEHLVEQLRTLSWPP